MKKMSNYHHGNLKEELLIQSLKIIQTEGIDSLTLQILASKLGTSRSAIYRHFSSKEDLIHNIIYFGFKKFEENLSPIFSMKNKSILEKLHLVGDKYINFAIENPNLYRMLFGDKFQDMRESSCNIEKDEHDGSFKSLINLFIKAQESTLIKKDNPITQTQILFSMCHGMSLLYIDGHMNIKENIKELYELSFETVKNGLLIK